MSQPERFNWLHLTDLHFGQSGQSPLWPNVRGAFFEDLKRQHDRSGPWHAVLFTGDFVQAGKPDQFKALEAEVLAPLWKELTALGSGDAVLLAVPGNHDLVRPAEKKAAVRQLVRPGGFAEIEEDFWGDPDNEYFPVISAAFSNYQNWWENTLFRHAASITDGLLPGDFATTLEVGTRRVGVVGLNTTFLQLAGGDFLGRLAWDVRQFHAVCGGDGAAWCGKHDVCLLLTHQGPEWLDPRSRNEVYPEINPAGRFAAHLFGHMHETVIRGTSYGGGRPLRQWQGNSLFSLEKFGEPPQQERRHGYGAGRIDFSRKTMIRFWPLLGVKDTNGWRFVPDEKNCVLKDDRGTEPESVSGENASDPKVTPAAAVVPFFPWVRESPEFNPYAPYELHHVSVVVSDLDASRNFYGRILGLDEIERPEFRFNDVVFSGAWYKLLSGQHLHLVLYPDGTAKRLHPERVPKNASELDFRDNHFALRVGDIYKVADRLEREGVEIIRRSPSMRRLPQLYILDPDGNIVEINEWSELLP